MDDHGPASDEVGDGTTTVCPQCAVGCHLARDDDRSCGDDRSRADDCSCGDDHSCGDDRSCSDDHSRADGRAGPANPEGRLCAAGIRAFEVLDAGDRLTRPLVAEGDEQVPVDWETALEAAVAGFEAVLSEHGPAGLAFLGAPHCTNEENYLLGKLARTLGTNDVDNRARLCHVGTAKALSERLGWPATTGGLEDLGRADVVLVVGANPAERQPVAFDSFVRPAVNDGTTLVHVDPVGNATTRLADLHLAPRPGRDALVLDLLCAHVVEAGGVDRAFVAGRTRGFEAFAAGLADLDCEMGASVAGVDPGTLGRVGDRLANADRVAAAVGTGIEGGGGGDGGANRSGGAAGDEGADRSGGAGRGGGAAGTEAAPVDRTAPDALVNLLLLSGNVGRPGTGLFVLRGLANEQGATDAGCVPDRLPGHRPVTDPDARARVAAQWGVEPPAEPGATADEVLAAFGDRVRGALVVGENPVVSKRDPDWLARKVDALDALVVVDVAPSETTPHADVVLPGAAAVEKAGTVTNIDRRVQRLRPTAPPPGEARPAFDILRTLGRRLVGDGHFDYAGPAEAFDELTRVAPTHAGVAYDDLDGGGRRWLFDEGRVLYRETFSTGEGRAPFVPPRGLAAVDGVADGRGAARTDTAGTDGFFLVTGGRAGGGRRGEEASGGRRDGRASGGHTPRLRMHPADADERGLAPGAAVVVSNGETAVETTVRRDDEVRRGTVYLHASAADPLLRDDAAVVTVEAV